MRLPVRASFGAKLSPRDRLMPSNGAERRRIWVARLVAGAAGRWQQSWSTTFLHGSTHDGICRL